MITFTGADEATDLEDLRWLASKGEVGFLITLTPDGRKRYPRFEWVAKALQAINNPYGVALHICGSGAKRMLFEDDEPLAELLESVHRIQINGDVSPDQIVDVCERYEWLTVITQHTERSESLAWTPTCDRHSVLVDSSGGREVLCKHWPSIQTTKPVGFAGGLGPSNLEVEIPRILKVAKPGWWVDMEASLRDENDQFSILRAQAAFHAYQAAVRLADITKTEV